METLLSFSRSVLTEHRKHIIIERLFYCNRFSEDRKKVGVFAPTFLRYLFLRASLSRRSYSSQIAFGSTIFILPPYVNTQE